MFTHFKWYRDLIQKCRGGHWIYDKFIGWSRVDDAEFLILKTGIGRRCPDDDTTWTEEENNG